MFVNIINSQPSLGGNRGVLAAADQLLKEDRPFALAIVVNAKGSTYRKPGALALFAGDDVTRSVISGGCLESSWHKVASHVIARNEPQSLLLDTHSDDDLIFGSGSGCRGSMRLLIIPVFSNNIHPLYSLIADAHRQRERLKLGLIMDDSHCAQGMAWPGDQQVPLGDHADKLKFMFDRQPGEYPALLTDGKEITVAVFDICPAPEILLIGASVETPHLIRQVHALGWHVAVADHRPAQLAMHAAQADESIPLRPAAVLAQHTHAFNAALVMSHNASTDIEALRMLSTRQESYVGLLGPPARRDELFAQLTDTERQSLQPRLHAPVGLRLGGDGPEALALSIVAELQQFFHNA